jgi:hypothetical protein
VVNQILRNPRTSKTKIILWAAAFVCLLLLAGISVSLARRATDGPLLINEFVASNGLGLADDDGDFSDWIEIYNAGNQPVNLAGYTLTDDPTLPAKWRFPDVTLGSGDYLLVYASGKNRAQAGQPLHANFRLSKNGDFLGLYRILDQRFVDAVEPQYPPQFRDLPYGRIDADTFGFLSQVSPGAANTAPETWTGAVKPVAFSVQRGFFEQPIRVELTTATPDATIRYTTDGSDPAGPNGQPYAGPINIDSTTTLQAIAQKDGLLPAPATTHTYIFTDNVLAQPANPPDFPQTWGRHQIDFKEFVAGTPVEADYEMDPDIVGNPRYREELTAGLSAIPSLSIVTDGQAFADLYSNPQGRGPDWERPVSVELIVPDGSGPGFQTNAGLRIQGGVGRNEFYVKHSFRLFFRGEYGDTTLNYPLFANSPVTGFDTLVLRGGVNRSFNGTFENRETTYARDQWLRDSQIEMSGVGANGTFVHLFINGLYWGLYNLTERPDAEFAASYLGGEPDDWVVMNHGGPVDGPETELAGLIELYRDFATAGDDPTERARLRELVESLVDVPQFFDYIIANWYGGNQDWGENNWYAARRLPDGPLHYFVWDAEKTWFDGADIYLGRTDASRPNVVIPILRLLLDDPDYRQLFTDRLYLHLANDGALTDANAQARWLTLTDPLELAIAGESARWGDSRHNDPITPDDWRAARANVLAQMDGNAAKLLQLAREQGFYPALDPPDFNQRGGLIDPDFRLELSGAPPGATIYYTTSGNDPRQPGGEIAPDARPYREPIPLQTDAVIKARAFDGESWSALNEASFKLAEQVTQLVISELMFNPPAGNAYEFIELKNVGTAEIDLSNATFEGINFTFPANALLQPGELLVLASNAEAFAEQYPGAPLAGVYRGNLSNAGERISLRDAAGNVLVSVAYADENGWPLSADGRGDSLVLIRPNGDPDNPKSWRASIELHGSPGRDESGASP